MGFDNKDYENIKLDSIGQNFHRDVYYKQAGNSICVNVLKAIFEPIINFENRTQNV
jgi:site-specific DNA-cytosine methylase